MFEITSPRKRSRTAQVCLTEEEEALLHQHAARYRTRVSPLIRAALRAAGLLKLEIAPDQAGDQP